MLNLMDNAFSTSDIQHELLQHLINYVTRA